MTRCKHCREEKPLDDFYTDRKAGDGRRPECKSCNLARRKERYDRNPRPYIDRVLKWQRDNPERVRANMDRFRASGKKKVSDRKSHLKRNYGITLEEFEAMLASQGGGCAICGRSDADNVDHDHETGRVRGILCFPCNVAIGLLQDDDERARSAASYISRDDELSAVVRGRAVALRG